MAEGNSKSLSLESMGGFVYYSLDKIMKLSNKSRDKKLRSAVADAQNSIYRQFQTDRAAAQVDKDADKYFLPFKLACEYRKSNIKLLQTSLDAIQRMIAYGWLTGSGLADPSIYPPVNADQKAKGDKKELSKRRRKLIDVLVETIYQCSTVDDDQVQIQVIKALITAVQSKTCHVHDHSVLLAVRSCYHIYLTAKNTSNQTTARAILTQMLNVVFQKMEHFAQQLRECKAKNTESGSNTEAKLSPPQPTPAKRDTKSNPPPPAQNGLAAESTEKATVEADSDASPECPATVAKEVLEEVVSKVAGDSDGAAAAAATADAKSTETEKRENKDQSETTEAPLPGTPVSAASIKSSKNKPLPIAPGAASKDPVDGLSMQRRLATRLHVMQNDAYLLFRALTQLSMKKLPDNNDPVAVKSKALSLELLLSVIEHSGPMFRSHPKFVGLIKDKLVRSLLQNCVSPIQRIYKMAAPMFIALVAQFKTQLKHEIGVILNNIFLNMLASPMSSYMQKSMAVVILLKLCKDPQTMVELFLNFDCDENCEDIFEVIIIQLEKVAQGRFMSEALMSPQNEASLRLKALEVIGHIMSSLLQWCSGQKKKLAEDRRISRADSKDIDNDDASQSDATDVRATPSRPAFSEQFNRQRERRNMIEKAILMFNRKPKRGIKYLMENKLVDNDPQSVSDFLQSHKKLNKTQIGEYMGEDKDFNKAVCYKYIEGLDFHGMEFDMALRHWLKGFRLPGEGQKIDRMVVKFADQYTTNNPIDKGGTFRTADGAYVLAYSTIMLHTDLHNPGVKVKMTKEQFINMNRGIDDGNDIDPNFMSHLYDRIQEEEIHMTGDKDTASEWTSAAALNPRIRQTMYQKETESLIKQTESLIKRKPKGKHKASQQLGGENGEARDDVEWYDATHADLEALKPMFDLLWCPAFATFSLVLKENDDPKVAQVCLLNYQVAVQLSSLFHMDTPREAFVKSLQHFSLLGTAKQFGHKNVQAFRTLLDISYLEGDHLKDSWGVVLQCVSEYEKLLRRNPGSQTNVDVFDTMKEAKRTKRNLTKAQQVQYQNARILKEQLDSALVDRVFTHSANLNSEAIVDFVQALTLVSEGEVFTAETPRVFSLQKIVEITYYNMNRIRLVWSRIWSILSAYFAKAGCHTNLQVSLYSIDSLRQLAMKFLEKDELAHYHFQKQFLKPFEVIMANTKAQESKALIIQCISRMVLGRVSNVRSGWKSVFIVLRIAAADPEKSLVNAAFALMERIMQNYFTLIRNTLYECVDTLRAFSKNKFTTISLKSLDYLEKCAKFLASTGIDQKDRDAKSPTADTKRSPAGDAVVSPVTPGLTRQFSDDDHSPTPCFSTWMALLSSCGQLITDPRFPLQNRALELMFGTLSAHGSLFTLNNWTAIFRNVLFPVFDDVRGRAITPPSASQPPPPAGAPPKQPVGTEKKGGDAKTPKKPKVVRKQTKITTSREWLKTTCLKAMTKVVQLFGQFQLTIKSLLPEVLALVNSCIHQGNISLSNIGVQCWEELVSRCGSKFDDNDWLMVLKALNALLEQTLPHELNSPRIRKLLGLQVNGSSKPDQPDAGSIGDIVSPNRVLVKCFIQEQMLAACLKMFLANYKCFKADHVMSLLQAIENSIEFVASFNADAHLRAKLFKAGFRTAGGGLFSLMDQEVKTCSTYLKMLQRMYQGGNKNFDDIKASEAKLQQVGLQILKRYEASRTSDDPEGEVETTDIAVVVCTLIQGFSEYTKDQLESNMPAFFPSLLSLIEHGDPSVRKEVAGFMRKQIGPLLPWASPSQE